MCTDLFYLSVYIINLKTVIILSNDKNICIINSNGLRVSDNYVLYTVTIKLKILQTFSVIVICKIIT